ncbi:DUF1223 domain-containing protein [Qipengyuania qiaonensis]|uniref:DUF1223 domain-containing protein n=1 Tax=Qipengyuania qiaonensis TaxID=2867240 RepID=A0ABS7J7B3_9SPHN|nr:DUF1223 domain-containing protein [Qipengyuania qiaonensis]MBX7481769.1 DUF1223 domain-containing protein [Qipengyuania qiaonensis]
MKNLALLLAIPAVAIAAVALKGEASSARTVPAPDPDAPVLVELFTSQGCSSCPPADALAKRLAREKGVVVISRPVTYWDRLGWKDTLAREDNTQLQRAYALRGLAGNNGVYTPQIVVDGRRGTVGSNETQVRQMIGYERAAKAAIAIRRQDDGSLVVGLAGAAPNGAELVLVALRSHVTVRILSGENGRRAIGYTNVLVDEQRVIDWAGGKAGVRIAASDMAVPQADRFALVLREKDAGEVLAARLLG